MASARVAAGGVSLLLLVAGPAPLARAATIPVTTLEDVVDPNDAACSLREAIIAVDSPPGNGDCVRAEANANTISLPAGRHVLTRVGAGEQGSSTGDLDIDNGTVSLTIAGAGVVATTIDAAGLGDRLFEIVAGAPSVAFRDLTLTGGRAPAGQDGPDGVGGTAGQPGGAIRSQGALSLTDVAVDDNRAGAGGAGGKGDTSTSTPGPGAAGGTGGSGGAISTSAALTLTRTSFSFNFAGNGGAGGSGSGSINGGSDGGTGGPAGQGGAVHSSAGTVTVRSSVFEGNGAGRGGAGGAGGFAPGSSAAGSGANGGSGGRAGAISALGMTVGESTFTSNSAGDGGAGGNGGDASFDGFPDAGGNGGTGGSGGALFSQTGDNTLTNLTMVGNRAGTGGEGGAGGSNISGPNPGGAPGGSGGNGGFGGALRRQLTGTAFLTHSTVTGNFAGLGGTGGRSPFGTPGTGGSAGSGAGLSESVNSGTAFTRATNSIVASNGTSNCAGGIVDGGHNLAFGDTTCGFPVADPKLGSLQDNGGPADTVGLLAGSPAIDQVPAAGADCPATDERGAARPSPSSPLCDIGAFEVTPPACQPVTGAAIAGQPLAVTLTCTSAAGAPITYSIAAQPAQGTLSGLDPAAGTVTYTASATHAGADGFTFQGTTADGSATASVTLDVTAPPTAGPGPGGPQAPAGPGTPAPGPGAAATAPVLTALRLSPGSFTRRRGARVTFRLDRAASVTFTVRRRPSGRRVRGSLRRAGRAGANRFRFTGRLGTRRLPRGRYVLVAVPAAAGLTGRAVQVRFTVRG